MATSPRTDAEGYDVEIIGTSRTNTTPDSQHLQMVDARYLWSFAQEEALVAISEQGADRRWRLIADPERRARRIAARYADLYFRSAEKSRCKLQLYWPALAAFVVKDIVEAFRYAREQVLRGGWTNAMRTSAVPATAATLLGASPYEHSLRVYTALAKGNLWLFQDVYPWLWYVLEYGLDNDGTLNEARLRSHVEARDAATFQQQSAHALKHLPFGAAWMGRLTSRLQADPVYSRGRAFFDSHPAWVAQDGGYGQHQAQAFQAHRYVRQHVKEYDAGYRMPPSNYWSRFDEAFYVMEEERREWGRIAADGKSRAALEKIACFKATSQIRETYRVLIKEYKSKDSVPRLDAQKKELAFIAEQEQLNILQPLIYADAALADTMAMNHRFSRLTNGFISPKYAVIYSAQPTTDDPKLKTVFDPPASAWDWATGTKANLADPIDRMQYVKRIAYRFNDLMSSRRNYMEGELRMIRKWLDA